MSFSKAADLSEISIEKAVKDVCRICLHTFESGIDLSSDNEESRNALETIYLCFQITISLVKYLPTKICDNCILELNVANSFRLKCISFEERFEICFKNLTNTTHHANLSESCQQNNTENVLHESNDSKSLDIKFDPESPHAVDDEYLLEKNSNEDKCVKKDAGDNDDHKCEICDKILKSKASLLKHNVSKHQKREHIGKVTGSGATRRYHCTSCSYSTPHSQTLVNHMRRHDGVRPYRCECGKTFTQSSSLAAHQKTHSNATYFSCSICGKQFKHAFTLKTHLRVHENGNFICNICQKVLKSKHSLRAHIHRHNNIRNYNCEYCGDTFVASSELINHRKKHGTEKSVECHLCDYKTHTKKNLVIHLKRHVGEKRFKCNTCEVTFYTGADLKRHRREHTGEKPFSCPTCAQCFTQRPSLKKHLHKVHGVEYKQGDFKEIKQGRKTVKKIKKDQKEQKQTLRVDSHVPLPHQFAAAKCGHAVVTCE